MLPARDSPVRPMIRVAGDGTTARHSQATPYCREALRVETLPDRPTVIGGHFKWYTDNAVCAARPSSHPLDCLVMPLAAPSGPCSAREGATAVDACDAAHDPGVARRAAIIHGPDKCTIQFMRSVLTA